MQKYVNGKSQVNKIKRKKERKKPKILLLEKKLSISLHQWRSKEGFLKFIKTKHLRRQNQKTYIWKVARYLLYSSRYK